MKNSRILAYHSISIYKKALPASIDLHPLIFEKHLKLIRILGFRAVFLDEMPKGQGNKPADIGKNPGSTGKNIAITFDDGYMDNFTNAWPLLKKYHCPATIFLSTAHIGGGFPVENGLNPVMGIKEIKELSKDPMIEIASHGHEHLNLAQQEDGKIRQQLKNSKDILEDITGKKVRYLAYPFGQFDHRVKNIAQDLGFEAAYSVWTKNPDRFSQNRIPIARTDEYLAFILKISPLYFPLKKILKR